MKFYASFPFLSIFFYSSLKVSGLLCWLFFSFNFLRNQSSANDMFCFEYRHIFIIMIICVLQTHKDINNIQNRGYFKLTYVYLCMYIILCISYCKHSPNIANFLYKSTKAVHTSSMKNTPCHPRSYFFNTSHKISQASDKKKAFAWLHIIYEMTLLTKLNLFLERRTSLLNASTLCGMKSSLKKTTSGGIRFVCAYFVRFLDH